MAPSPLAKTTGCSDRPGAAYRAGLNAASDPYCTELLRGRALESSARALFTAERAAEFIAGRHPDSLPSLIAGCRNFFEMNDLRPDRDFAAIRALYPEARFECYSVGLLQPYIMHSVLGCDELSMLDINWRILELHAHILKAADSRALDTTAAVRESLAEFYLKFPAMGGNRLNAPLPAAIERLCRPLQHDYCRTVLPAFQQKLAVHAPQFVQLQLSSLHDGRYRTPRENRLRVIFLSNAIEESYTSADEFRKFLSNLRESARAPIQPDLLIHHVGGWKLFGIYALYHEPVTEEPRIATLCKDSYLSMSRGAGETPVEYLTHFERQGTKANLSRQPSCAALANRGQSQNSQ